jgi:hypothetical protein
MPIASVTGGVTGSGIVVIPGDDLVVLAGGTASATAVDRVAYYHTRCLND